MTGTATGFDEVALAALPTTTPFVESLRKQAFEEFVALPIPSQETEEWRYTDLSELDLGFIPWSAGGRAENLDGVPAEILAAAGNVGARAGLQILRPRSVRTSSSHICTRWCRASGRSSRRSTRRSAPVERSCTCLRL
jgi:hypothetical protein